MPCVCGKGFSTELCCGRFLSGDEWPVTAEELMRSRYAAYALHNPEYLRETHTFGDKWNYQQNDGVVWERLEVLDTVAGQSDDEEGQVEFKAWFRVRPGESVNVIHERSNFVRRDGRWYYTDGFIPGSKPLVRESPKVGRNDPCPCGSGKKHKKCCGA